MFRCEEPKVVSVLSCEAGFLSKRSFTNKAQENMFFGWKMALIFQKTWPRTMHGRGYGYVRVRPTTYLIYLKSAMLKYRLTPP